MASNVDDDVRFWTYFRRDGSYKPRVARFVLFPFFNLREIDDRIAIGRNVEHVLNRLLEPRRYPCYVFRYRCVDSNGLSLVSHKIEPGFQFGYFPLILWIQKSYPSLEQVFIDHGRFS